MTQKISSAWNDNAEAWIEGVRSGLDRFRKLFHDPHFYNLLPELNNLSVLDIGCGEGIVSRKMESMGARVTGLDISEKLIAAAKASSQENDRLRYFVSSFEKMDCIPDQEFDLIVSVMALMDSPGLMEALAECRRVLRPGGILVFSVTHPVSDRAELEFENNSAGIPVRAKLESYFDQTPWQDVWSFTREDGLKASKEPFKIWCHPRKVSDYLNALGKNRFFCDRMEEPQPDETVCRNDPSKLLWQWRILPFYLMIRCVKI